MRRSIPIITLLAMIALAGCREKEEELPFPRSTTRPAEQTAPRAGTPPRETQPPPPSVEVAEWPELLKLQEKIATRIAETEAAQVGRLRAAANETSIEVVMFLASMIPPVRDRPAVEKATAELDDISKQLMRSGQLDEQAIRAEFARLEANLEQIRIAAGVPAAETNKEETQ